MLIIFQIFYVDRIARPALHTQEVGIRLIRRSNNNKINKLPGIFYPEELKIIKSKPTYKKVKNLFYLPKQKLFRLYLFNFPSTYYIDLNIQTLLNGSYIISNTLRGKIDKLRKQYGI